MSAAHLVERKAPAGAAACPDLRLFRNADWDAWRRLTTAQIEASGQQEMLNWFCLAGAMEALDRTPEIVDWVESWTNNSNKCLALFKS